MESIRTVLVCETQMPFVHGVVDRLPGSPAGSKNTVPA